LRFAPWREDFQIREFSAPEICRDNLNRAGHEKNSLDHPGDFSLTLLCGCGESSLTTTEKGAIIGTGAGASLGAVIVAPLARWRVGAGVGAVVGLVGGALIGDQIQERKSRNKSSNSKWPQQQAQIDRAEQDSSN